MDVTKRATVDITNLTAFLDRFPRLLEDELTALENEFLEYQLLDDNELLDTSIVMADEKLKFGEKNETGRIKSRRSLSVRHRMM